MTTDRCPHGELMTDSCAACDGYTKAEAVASASVPAGGTPGGLAREKVDEQQAAVNPADRPATEPRTEAMLTWIAQQLLNRVADVDNRDALADIIDEAGKRFIEAEAAQGAAPLTLVEVREFLGRAIDDIEANRWRMVEKIDAALSEGAAPRAEGLDDEETALNLSMALVEAGNPSQYRNVGDHARAIVAALRRQQARLSRPSDERVPESEER